VSKPDLAKQLKNVSDRDRKQIQQAQEMLGPDPASMGFIKNLFWGNFREDLVLPFPETSAEETARCDQLVAALDEYLRTEHPTVEIDQTQQIPDAAIRRLFDLGVMGMIIPQEFGGGGYGLTSYNRVLKRIGQTCGSTAVMVSAHQSIGCGAIVLFGTEEQKRRFLPRMAKDTLSAFCLSEPNVGCDAGGQETHCEKTPEGDFIITSGEKKWATSAALAGLFTVMAKQTVTDPKTGKESERVTALICTPDMKGVDIFSRNRSKVSIRGTWQARIRFNNVRVPKENLLHLEGKGLNVALSCLNYGRCTLSAGMVGAAQTAMEQAAKWATYRHQFDRPIAEFDLMQDYLARIGAYVYATEAMLYMTTGMLDRGDEDIMLETALCKVFCSEMGWRAVDHAMQIMGGEGFMTENELERIWRDSRINVVVEGANEVMHSFVFAYGSKQLGEWMLGVKDEPMRNLAAAMRIGAELYAGLRRPAPHLTRLSPRLAHLRHDLERHVREFSHQVKMMFKAHGEKLVTNQMIQRRVSECALWLHAMTCTLSRADRAIRAGHNGETLQDELAIVEHVCAMANEAIDGNLRSLRRNTDPSMRRAAAAVLRQCRSLPNDQYAIPERTPDLGARGTGKAADQTHIPQFGGGSMHAGKSFATERATR
jgi:alkylation response protein AidB-like acyl-CoA dehydrogenase